MFGVFVFILAMMQNTGSKMHGDAGSKMPETRCQMPDSGFRIQDAESRMQDPGCNQFAGYRMPDAGCKIQDLR